MAISPLGYYYVADTLNNRLQVFTAAGAFNRKLGDLGTQSGYFNQPEGVGVDRLGLVYVADTQNHRVQVFDNGLRFLGQLGTTGSAGTDTTQLNYPRDVQVGVDGRIFVLDSLNYRVQIFNRLRQYVGTLGSFGEQPGQLKLAFAVNPVANSSQVYVADTYNHRIQLIDTAVDGDRDGMDDLWESRNGLNNLDGFDWASDLDGDGVSAIGEFRLQINPLLLDTDGDETSDGLELLLGWNPADPQYGLLRVTGFRATDPLGVIVRYMTEAGGTYRVESSPELLAPAWSLEPASELTVSVSGIRAYTNAPAAPRVKYYRAVRVR